MVNTRNSKRQKQHDEESMAITPDSPDLTATTTTITSLNPDCLYQIAAFLDPVSIVKLGSTCKSLTPLSNDKLYWKNILEKIEGGNLAKYLSTSPLKDCLSFKELWVNAVYKQKCSSCTEYAHLLFSFTGERTCATCLHTNDKYAIISRSAAMTKYLVTASQLKSIPFVGVGKKGTKDFMGYMELLEESEVQVLGIERWGSLEALEEEREERVAKTKTRYEKALEEWQASSKKAGSASEKAKKRPAFPPLLKSNGGRSIVDQYARFDCTVSLDRFYDYPDGKSEQVTHCHLCYNEDVSPGAPGTRGYSHVYPQSQIVDHLRDSHDLRGMRPCPNCGGFHRYDYDFDEDDELDYEMMEELGFIVT